ncbi:MAG: sporulation protein YqfD [Clostridia bacterium]|nr:sporulation protein YqfD [Clostridia bacterium]
MWIWRMWRWLCSEVRFCAQGGLCEAFLNSLREDGIVLWDVQIRDGVVTASCKASAYRRLRAPARRTGTRVRAVSYRGASKTFRPLRKRGGLLVGALAATAFYMVLASHIWVVDIAVDNEAVRQAVMNELAACGIAVGRPLDKADPSALSMRAVAAVDGVHDVFVWFDGCIAHVDVRTQEKEIVHPDTSPGNVVAKRDGRILELRVAAGQTMVKVGEGVVAGDLLVSGAVETTAGVYWRHASAVVTAQTERVYEGYAAREETVEVETARCDQRTVTALWWRLPLYSSVTFSDTWTATTTTAPLTMFGTPLPVGIETRTYIRREPMTVRYTDEEVMRLATARATAKAAAHNEGIAVVDTVTEGEWDGDTYRVRVVTTCEEDIAEEVPILFATE